MRLEINQIWQNCYEVRNQPNLAELLSIGYTLRSRELCDLFTECRRHEVNKKHSPETEVYNMLLLWGICTKQRFAA